MATTTRRTLLAALTAGIFVACTAQAQAQFRLRLGVPMRTAPPVMVAPPVVAHGVPYLGFESHFDGTGEQITAVQYGATAWRIGLEPGDKIIAVNGVRLRYHGHGRQLLQAAAYHGRVTLAILDWRTSLVVHRTVHLNLGAVAVRSSGYVIRPGLRPSAILRRLPR